LSLFSGLMKYHQGRYVPKNPKKYKGDANNIFYRSSWELTAMRYFDTNPGILSWASEELAIPYVSPIDKSVHRYFPDFIIQTKDVNEVINTYIVEIKPSEQLKAPKMPKRKTKRYVNDVLTHIVNEAKWESARSFCKKQGLKFLILTEKEIYGRGK